MKQVEEHYLLFVAGQANKFLCKAQYLPGSLCGHRSQG
jgi:hypothetical protein